MEQPVKLHHINAILTWKLQLTVPPSAPPPALECGPEISAKLRRVPCQRSPFHLPHSYETGKINRLTINPLGDILPGDSQGTNRTITPARSITVILYASTSTIELIKNLIPLLKSTKIWLPSSLLPAYYSHILFLLMSYSDKALGLVYSYIFLSQASSIRFMGACRPPFYPLIFSMKTRIRLNPSCVVYCWMGIWIPMNCSIVTTVLHNTWGQTRWGLS